MNEQIMFDLVNRIADNDKVAPFQNGFVVLSNEEMVRYTELIVRECAKELREAEQEADRAYKAKEVKERNTFDGYDFADMLEERFGVKE